MAKPIAVLISDIHYSLPTLELADAAMRQAIAKANELGVPLIVAGDLHDTKANMRAECVNAMLETFNQCLMEPIILIGNHDRINERASAHSLNFLSTYFKIIKLRQLELPDEDRIWTAGYYHDPEELRNDLKKVPKGSTIIMHQGIEGSNSGDYIQDRSAINYEDVKDFRVISGHYHQRQDIKTGPPRKGAVGIFSYIGNPYTLNFGEANDPEKGFQILMDDGTLEFVPTNLRRHYIVHWDLTNDDYTMTFPDRFEADPDKDLCLVRMRGTKERLQTVDKRWVARRLFGSPDGIKKMNFRLELIPDASESDTTKINTSLPQTEVLDSIIDSLTNTSAEQKTRVKELWKSLT